MPYKQQKSKYWYIRVPGPAGGRVRQSSGTTSYREAEALENRLNAEAYQAEKWGIEPPRSFDVLFLEYLKEIENRPSYDRIKFAAKPLYKHFTGYTIQDLRATDINDYKRKRLEDKVSNSTIRKELITFSTAINYACREWGWKVDNPITGRLPPKDAGRVRWLTRNQANTLIEAAGKLRRSKRYLPDLILLALNTGMRRGELLGLEWSRVDFQHRKIYLEPEHQKGRRRDSIPLNHAAQAVLKRRREDEKAHKRWVFSYRQEKIQSVKKAFGEACEKAGIVDFRFHDLRHTCAAWLVQAGVPMRNVADFMRHRDGKHARNPLIIKARRIGYAFGRQGS